MSDKAQKILNDVYEQGFAVSEDFFNPEQVDALLRHFESCRSDLKKAGIGKDENAQKLEEIRSDSTFWLEKGMNADTDRIFYARLEELILHMNRRFFLGLNGHEFHFALYSPGNFYKRHKDVFKQDDARKISVVLYLNKHWQNGMGGELVIYREREIHVEPRAGTLVMFESHLEHEVLPCKQERYSLTGWLKSSSKKGIL